MCTNRSPKAFSCSDFRSKTKNGHCSKPRVDIIAGCRMNSYTIRNIKSASRTHVNYHNHTYSGEPRRTDTFVKQKNSMSDWEGERVNVLRERARKREEKRKREWIERCTGSFEWTCVHCWRNISRTHERRKRIREERSKVLNYNKQGNIVPNSVFVAILCY